MLDGDLVRVDILKVKRKLYEMLPEDKKKEFILSSKKSELDYLSGLLPKELTDVVFQEYKKVIGYELIDILISLGVGFGLSLVVYMLHVAYPKNNWFSAFMLPFGFGIYYSLKHGWYIIDQYRKIRPFKKEYAELQQRIGKISEEIRNIK